MKSFKLALLLSLCVITVSACQKDAPKQNVVNVQGQTMGTYYSVSVFGQDKLDAESLEAEANKAFSQVINAISTFDDSEILRFNNFKSTEPFAISPYLASVIEESRRESLRLGGAMDFTVGPLVDLWGFGPKAKPTVSPTQEQIDAAKKLVGLDKYELRRDALGNAYLVKTNPDVGLDLSTIGEGLGADLLASRLQELGITNYIVSVAGASRSLGYNASNKEFKIGIEDPDLVMKQGSGIYSVICPHGQAVSTAGSYRNYFEENGLRYSHIIDPTTGKPITHKTVSVTVVGDTAAKTDALDTGLLVLGKDEAIKWAQRNDEAIYVIYVEDGKLKAAHSRAFEKYLKCQ